MQINKKIFIFLPDGVGLRNFAFTKFKEKGEQLGYEITYWNATSFELQETFGFNEIKIPKSNTHPFTDLYKRAKIRAELNYFEKRFKDPTFQSYKFKQNYKGIKNAIKSNFVDILVHRYSNQKGIKKLQQKIDTLERKSVAYEKARAVLEKEQPSIVFCTNQRASEAIAPVLAAKDLNIATAAFIFSWDNLPKATKIIDTDFYFVWSDFMKQELLTYYPSIDETQIIVSGTPQFEAHYDDEVYISKKKFYNTYGLDANKEYICFSGDDKTTSPFDEYYLEDLADVVNELNQAGHEIGILFRRCPVDFSNRYNKAITKYKNLIIPVAPKWERMGAVWNTIMPTKEDTNLLVNTAKHTFAVMNIGSSMVFDYAAHNKSCMYINYNQPFIKPGDKTIEEIYKYIHFRSMPNKDSVIWINRKEDLKSIILQLLKKELTTSEKAKNWFKVINIENPTLASDNIWKGIQHIIAN